MRIAQGAAASNTGRKRRHNEDAYVYEPPLFAVADGMGGARAGELASSLAASTVHEHALDPTRSAEEAVAELIQAANARVHQRAVSDAAAAGMGTTMTVALLQPDGHVVIGHVGDSRAYVLRDDRLEQLTDDHSLVAELVRRGELSPEQAEVHPQRSVITRALGTEATVDIDAFTVEGREGDIFLLCSDGLTTMVDTATIAEIVREHRFELPAASRALIRAANDRGGEDNITAVLFALGAGDELAGGAPSLAPAVERFEDDDTLHPEDGVAPLDAGAMTTVGEFSLDLAAAEPTQADERPDRAAIGVADEETAPRGVGQSLDQHPAADHTEQSLGEGPARAGIGQILLAQLVILVLTALIVFLVVKGFAQ
jgi:protein phosphatase